MTDPTWTECPVHGAYVTLGDAEPICPSCGVTWVQVGSTSWPIEEEHLTDDRVA